MRRTLGSVVLAVVVLLGLPGARPAVAEVSPTELAASDVVIEPGASVSDADRQRLVEAARELRSRGVPTKFVVVANRPVNPPQTARDLRRAIAFNGNVLVLSLSPNNVAIDSALPAAVRQKAFEDSVADLRADPITGTIALAERLTEAAASASSGGAAGAPERSGDDGGGGGSGVASGLALVGVLLVGFFAILRISKAATRRRAEADLADRKAALEPLVDALAAHVTDLSSDLRFGGDRAAQAQPHYDEAVLAYGEVRDAMPTARTAPALETIRQTLERGLRAAQSARAVLDGRPLPPPEEIPLLEGLCAFDPKHGRVVRTMPVTTPAGDEAELPVCAQCAAGLEAGQMPDPRRVYQRGMAVPYWQGLGSMGFGGGGLFPFFGGMLGGMVLHDLFTPDVALADHGGFGGDPGDGGWGGDFGGGGDFDGGDFGGDFGGGGDF
jgi:hypothetical protein